MNHWQHGWFDTQRIACRGTEFKLMRKRLISDAQESVGGVKLLSLERKHHSYLSVHVVKDEWQVMRRERWMEFWLVIMSAPARRCSFQSVDC